MKRHSCYHQKIALIAVLILLLSPAIIFAENGNKNSSQKRTSQSKRKLALHSFIFEEAPLGVIIRAIADYEHLNVVYEDSIAKLIESKKINFNVKDVTVPSALQMLLTAQRFGFAQVDKRTIVIFPEALANRQRYEDVKIRAFYLKYAQLEDARNAITQAIGSSKIIPLKQINALIIRDTEETFKLIESVISRIDKPQPEFVMDVNIYSVSDQIAFPLANQSGAISSNDLAQLQSRSGWKLLGSTKLHAFENESTAVNMGRRVPIQTISKKTSTNTNAGVDQNTQNSDNPATSTEGPIQFQYVDIGLNMEIVPIELVDDNIKMKMSIEISGATKSLPNPEFSQYRLKQFISFKRDEIKIVANTFSLDENGSVAVNQKGNVVVTITPHVVHPPEITAADNASFGPNGTANVYDASITLEEMILRADQDDESSK